MMYYNDYQKNNCKLSFVKTRNNDETEIWSIRDTDMNKLIGFMEYHLPSNTKSFTFEKHADVYGLQKQSFTNFVDVVKDFEVNVESRMYEGV